MSGETYALLQRLHGHIALLGLALLVHPLVSLRRRPGLSAWTRWTAELAALLLVLPYGIGWWLYPSYRAQVKPDLVQERLDLALLFETKEHLAVMTVALALGAALALRLAGRRPEVRTAAWWLLLLALCCGLSTGALGTWVASGASPAW